jgi:hypothetical protein
VRVVRGAVFSVVATLLAAAAHALAGGGAPSPLFCAVVAVLATPPATALAGGRFSVARTIAAVAASQVVYHAAFVLVGDLGRWGATTGHVHATMPLPMTAPDAGVAADPAMVLAHGLAALVTTACILRGERAVRAVLARLPRLRPAAATTFSGIPLPRSLALPETTTSLPRPRIGASSLSRRGPPASHALSPAV